MTGKAILNAIIALALMGTVTTAYVAMARRHRYLWHPVAVFVAVVVVSVVVSVLGLLLFGSGWGGVPAMLKQSAIGGAGWGITIAAVVWVSRLGCRIWMGRRRR